MSNKKTDPRQPRKRKEIHRTSHPRGQGPLIEKRTETRPTRSRLGHPRRRPRRVRPTSHHLRGHLSPQKLHRKGARPSNRRRGLENAAPHAHRSDHHHRRHRAHPHTSTEKVRRDRMREGHEGDLQLLGASMISGTQFLNDLGRYDAHLNRRFYRAVELMMKIRKEERKSREAQAAAESVDTDAAVRGNPSTRDRGVDGSPRSRSKTPIGFRRAKPPKPKTRETKLSPILTPVGTTRYEATGAIADPPRLA